MRCKTLKEYFERSGKRQIELAQEIGVSQALISLVKNGRLRPGVDVAKKISDKTGISVMRLLFPVEETPLSQQGAKHKLKAISENLEGHYFYR